jgi:hypothetical protein
MANPPNPPNASVPRVGDSSAVVGKLLEHGYARYRFEDTGSKSYYIKLRTQEDEGGARARNQEADQAARPIDGRTERRGWTPGDGGERILWGTDLKRAIDQSRSHVQIGQIVIARRISQEPVYADPKSSAPTGYRTRWEVETPRYMEQRQRFAQKVTESRRGAAQQGIDDPAVLALYLIHEGAERLAKVWYPNAEDEKKFLERLRVVLKEPSEHEAVIKGLFERLHQRQAAERSNGGSGKQTSNPDPSPPQREPLVRE